MTLDAANQFILIVPFGSESSGEIGFQTTANEKASDTSSGSLTQILSVSIAASSQTLDFPFPTEKPEAPQINRLSPSSVSARGLVTISGAGLYPTALAAVTINGIALDTANFVPDQTSDTSIQFIMPSAGLPTNTPMPVVAHTVFGVSGDSVTITLEGN